MRLASSLIFINKMPGSTDSHSTTSKQSFSSQSSTDSCDTTHYQFVVAGGSYAAISAVKLLCKHVIPQAVAMNPRFRAKITVIAPNKEAYWNVAAVRLIAEPDILKNHGNQIFFPLEESMRQHLPKTPKYTSPHILQVIQGKVLSIDSNNSMLTYLKLTEKGTSDHVDDFFCHSVSYHRLILATGASSSSPAFKLNGSSEMTKAALREFQESTQKASSICIVGAGGAGVELAGELGYKYGNSKKIQLYSSFDGTLERLRHKIADGAINKLKHLGVETITNSRAISAYLEPSENSKFEHHHEEMITSSSFQSTAPLIPQLSELCLNDHYDSDSNDKHSPSQKSKSNSAPGKSIFHRHSPEGICNISSPLPHAPISPTPTSNRSPKKTEGRSLLKPRMSTSSGNSSSSSIGEDLMSQSAENLGQRTRRTVVTFENGYKESFDCYIPTTGNIPNSAYLPHSCLDPQGYVITDPYLRLANNNPRGEIYVYGDLVSGGSQTIEDISDSQLLTLKATLFHDLLNGDPHELKMYKPSPVTFYVPISRKGGVGQTMHGFPIPGFVVSIVKSRNFRLSQSKNYLLK